MTSSAHGSGSLGDRSDAYRPNEALRVVNTLLPERLVASPAEPPADTSPLDVFPAEVPSDSFTPLERPRGNVTAPKGGVTPKPPRVRLDLDRANVSVDGVGRTLDDLREMGALIYRGYSRLDDICGETEQRSRKAFETLDAIERRIGRLDEARDLARAADICLASVRQIVEEFARRTSEFQAHREAIDRGLVEASRVDRLVSDLERRLMALAAPQVALEQAEARVTSVEQRSEQAVADLTVHVIELDTQRQAIESALAAAARDAAALGARVEALTAPDQLLRQTETRVAFVEHRIEQTSADITTRMSELDVKRESIDLALAAATHAAVTLDERVATLTSPEHVLHQAETAFEELEQRSTQTLADLSARVTGLGTQREAIESALAQAAQQAQALGERLTMLMAPEQALSKAEGRIDEIEQRTAHALTDLGARVADLDARRETIDAALTAAVRGTDALDQRVATLTAPEHALRQAELRFEDFEQRSTQALGNLATRSTELDAKREAIELALADVAQQTQALNDRLTSLSVPDEAVRQAEACVEEIEQRAAHAVTALSTRVTDLAAQRHAIDTALAEAARTTSTLQARVDVLTAPGHALRQAQSQVEDLEKYAAAALADLGSRATELTAQRQTIETVLAEAERAQTMLSDAEARLAALTNEDELRSVETTVADLEGRASDAAARLQRVVTKKDALGRALVNAQRQLQALDEAAQRDLVRLATASKRAARAANGSVPFWRIVAVSAVAGLVALGIITMRARTESASSLDTTQPLLTDATRSSPAITTTTGRTRPTAQSVPSSQLAVANAPAASPRQPAEAAKEVARPSQPTRAVSTPVTRKPVAESTRQPASTRAAATTTKGATAAAVQFVGDLEVSSEPSGATVYIDSKPVGQTPLSLQKIPAGSHVLWVVRDGHARWTRGVLVPANTRTRVSATLERIP